MFTNLWSLLLILTLMKFCFFQKLYIHTCVCVHLCMHVYTHLDIVKWNDICTHVCLHTCWHGSLCVQLVCIILWWASMTCYSHAFPTMLKLEEMFSSRRITYFFIIFQRQKKRESPNHCFTPQMSEVALSWGTKARPWNPVQVYLLVVETQWPEPSLVASHSARDRTWTWEQSQFSKRGTPIWNAGAPWAAFIVRP